MPKVKSKNQFTHPWLKEELKILDLWKKPGIPFKYIVQKIQEVDSTRSPQSIRSKLSRMGIIRSKERSFARRYYEMKDDYLLKEIREARNVVRPKTEIIIPKNKIIKTVECGDTHIPFQNNRAIKPVLDFLSDYKPDYLFLIGDMIDFYQISRFRKVPLTQTTIEEEVKILNDLLWELREACSKSTKIYYIEGNHEFRWRTYLIDNAPMLYDLISLKFTELLNLRRLDITYIPCRAELNKFSHNYIKVGDYYLGHFDKSLKNAAYTGRMLRDELGVNIIQGHNHRIGISYRSYLDDIKFGAEIGCLCSLSPAYLNNPDWQNGFSTLEFRDGEGFINLINIRNNRFLYGGKEYK
jgi:predicted phosphodiesterase